MRFEKQQDAWFTLRDILKRAYYNEPLIIEYIIDDFYNNNIEYIKSFDFDQQNFCITIVPHDKYKDKLGVIQDSLQNTIKNLFFDDYYNNIMKKYINPNNNKIISLPPTLLVELNRMCLYLFDGRIYSIPAKNIIFLKIKL